MEEILIILNHVLPIGTFLEFFVHTIVFDIYSCCNIALIQSLVFIFTLLLNDT